jgi:beta-lactamase class A
VRNRVRFTQTLFRLTGALLLVGAGALLGHLLGLDAASPRSATSDATSAERPAYIRRTWTAASRLVEPLIDCRSSQAPPRAFDALEPVLRARVVRAQDAGRARRVGVYVQDLVSGAALSINGAEAFAPASIMKVAVMVSALSQELRTPGFLDRPASPTGWAERGATLRPERDRLPRLLDRMIVHSDNAAASEIHRALDEGTFAETQRILGLPAAGDPAAEYRLTARHVGRIFRALYNAAPLGAEGSSTALARLTHTAFEAGLVAGLPQDLVVAHKYGQPGRVRTPQLHDCGIVYAPFRPYSICVMTSGDDPEHLAGVIAEISSAAWAGYGRGS